MTHVHWRFTYVTERVTFFAKTENAIFATIDTYGTGINREFKMQIRNSVNAHSPNSMQLSFHVAC